MRETSITRGTQTKRTPTPNGSERALYVLSTSKQFGLEQSSNSFCSESREQMGEIIDKVKGKVKRVAGALIGDTKLSAPEGRIEAKGKVKGVAEDVKHAVKNAGRNIANS